MKNKVLEEKIGKYDKKTREEMTELADYIGRIYVGAYNHYVGNILAPVKGAFQIYRIKKDKKSLNYLLKQDKQIVKAIEMLRELIDKKFSEQKTMPYWGEKSIINLDYLLSKRKKK